MRHNIKILSTKCRQKEWKKILEQKSYKRKINEWSLFIISKTINLEGANTCSYNVCVHMYVGIVLFSFPSPESKTKNPPVAISKDRNIQKRF